MKNLGNLLIFGDSYSTLEGYIPKGNNCYYGESRQDTLCLKVTKFEHTWWGKLMQATGANLLLNESYSGSTICYTGWNGYCEEQSFIARLDKLIQEGFFTQNRVDTLLLFGGTNDCWVPSPVGEIGKNSYEKEDLAKTYPALEYFLMQMKKASPNTRVIGLINTDFPADFTQNLQTIYKNAGVESITFTYIEKGQGHPNTNGMQNICDEILKYLENA